MYKETLLSIVCYSESIQCTACYTYVIYYAKYHYIIVKSHPELKWLKHVMHCDKTGLMIKWYDLGLELLDINASILDAIRDGHQNDADKCYTEMFKEWLARKPDASWDELITSLDNIKIRTVTRHVLKIIKLCTIISRVHIRTLEVISFW